jgi:hypothetical protein
MSDNLRSKFLAPKTAYSEPVEYQGEQVLLVAPTMKQKAAIYAAAMSIVDGAPTVDSIELNKRALVACLRERHSDGSIGPAILNDMDLAALDEEPAGLGLIDVLGPRAAKLLNGDPAKGPTAVKEAQETAKNA